MAPQPRRDERRLGIAAVCLSLSLSSCFSVYVSDCVSVCLGDTGFACQSDGAAAGDTLCLVPLSASLCGSVSLPQSVREVAQGWLLVVIIRCSARSE